MLFPHLGKLLQSEAMILYYCFTCPRTLTKIIAFLFQYVQRQPCKSGPGFFVPTTTTTYPYHEPMGVVPVRIDCGDCV